jgi:hypothetical protein
MERLRPAKGRIEEFTICPQAPNQDDKDREKHKNRYNATNDQCHNTRNWHSSFPYRSLLVYRQICH